MYFLLYKSSAEPVFFKSALFPSFYECFQQFTVPVICPRKIADLPICLLRYIWGGLLVLFGIFLNVYSKNREKVKLPSIKDLRSWLLKGKKAQFLSQNV